MLRLCYGYVYVDMWLLISWLKEAAVWDQWLILSACMCTVAYMQCIPQIKAICHDDMTQTAHN